MTKPFDAQRRNADDIFEHGIDAHDRGDLTTAIQEWRYALALAPRHVPSLYNLAIALAMIGDEKAAAKHYEKLLSADPTHKGALFNLALLRKRQGRHTEAENLYAHLTQAHPDYTAGWINLAKAMTDRGNIKGAEPILRHAIAIEPDNALAHWNLANLLLRNRSWVHAWAEYEWRAKLQGAMPTPVHAPLWAPEHNNKRVLLWNDQGMGDAIQFLRYAQALKHYGCEVFLLIQESLKRIAASAPGISKTFGPTDDLPAVDAQAPLPSLPHLLDLKNPNMVSNKPYLSWGKTMALQNRRSTGAVGLVWAGNQNFANDHMRSAPLSELGAFFQIKNIDWYSLQIGEASAQIKQNNLHNIIKEPPLGLRDFADTAAALNALDLVISVDTAVAHLAGAMGKKCWLMLPSFTDWRYQTDDMTKAWYPTMRTFRQPAAGDWESVALDIATALGQEIK